jgi:hypothetical protein
LINIDKIEEEQVVFLRNSDILTTSQRGVTTTTDTFSGDGTTTTFTLTNSNVKNVRSVTVDGNAQSFGTDYSVDYSNATITFTTAPATGTDNISVQYDYGNSDKIYSDYPRTDLSISSYPRISVTVTAIRTEDAGVGGKVNVSDILFSVVVFANGKQNVNNYIKAIRQAYLNNKSHFYYLFYIIPVAQGPLVNEPNRGDKIYYRNIDFTSPFNYERIT